MKAITLRTPAQAPLSDPVPALPVSDCSYGAAQPTLETLDSHAVWMHALAVAQSMTEKWLDVRQYRQF